MSCARLRDNESAFDRYKIRTRIMRDLTGLDASTMMFGRRVKFPFAFSPTAMHCLAHPDGEIATSKACASMDVAMALSAYSTKPLEDVVAQSSGNPYVIQMSLLKNKTAMGDALKRAEAAGFKAVFVTLDVPCLGRRLNEYRNGFSVPPGMGYPNLYPGADVSNLDDSDENMAYDPSFEWQSMIAFFRENTSMQIWGKGISGALDAEEAIKCGLDGIVISNHGGRQLDSAPATLHVLREVAAVVDGRIPIGIDGGIRRGTDIFKALALGASFCMAGRPALWGLAYGGQAGVELALNLLYDEFVTTMMLSGCVSP
ncbi:Aldolase-type TIM barrel [Moelleriella libera RCEF 2490]|uniref:Aldolase-type TIM barrel n=1 Tax=Moelleriella libera RCEF 2490 TaxID=1081109 RepID=A0A168AVH2_9HYPO|nr:Aldolase-type TIM barrel [Moelleriella libera RCEF 2490]